MSSASGISVITVVKNDARHLETTIKSVVAVKALNPVEFIIIDGASTDGSVDVIRAYSEHVSYWVSEPDNGIYDAMNKGWAVASINNFILFLGAGDVIISMPDLNSLKRQEVIYGTVRMGESAVFRSRADFHLKLYNSLHHQALLVHKSLHPEPPFNCNYPMYADFDFNQRLLKCGAHCEFSPDLIGYANPGGVSDRQNFTESLRIVWANYGVFWTFLAVSGYYAMKCIPFLKRLRPIQEI